MKDEKSKVVKEWSIGVREGNSGKMEWCKKILELRILELRIQFPNS